MVLFNYSTRELTAKVVYYGPGLCGKTTNLQYIHSTLPDNVKGKMLSLATKTDRTLFFDFLPIDLGQIRGMKTRVQLYTVPGQVFYNETRKLVLKGADGIVFVADSQATMLGANVESFKNLEENLKAHGMNLSEMPHVLQFNKRDLPKLANIEELNSAINRFNAPFYESVATTGIGVQDTLKAITKLVLLHLTKKYDPKTAAASVSAKATPPSVSVGVPPQAAVPPVAARADNRPVAPPTTAQTMQMPVARVQPPLGMTQGIPLSSTPDVLGAPPVEPVPFEPNDLMAGESSIDRQANPSFGDDEIQELVNEVQESEISAMSAEIAPDPAPAMEAFDLGGDIPPVDPHTPSADSELAVEPTAFTDNFASSQPEGPSVPLAGATGDIDAVPSFEIDHGVDPDWSVGTGRPSIPIDDAQPEVWPTTPAVDPPAGNDDGGVWDLGSIDDASGPSVDRVVPPAYTPTEHHHGPAELPRLTDAVQDTDLFEAPGLDVARLTAGEDREIVIPLEVEQSDRTVQRFKLSIRLRMEPID
jgi:signal recognition particle receptor subunit beta